MKKLFVRGMADSLDRVGATLITLCLLGGWFTEQFTWLRGFIGITFGIVFVILGVYTKARLDTET